MLIPPEMPARASEPSRRSPQSSLPELQKIPAQFLSAGNDSRRSTVTYLAWKPPISPAVNDRRRRPQSTPCRTQAEPCIFLQGSFPSSSGIATPLGVDHNSSALNRYPGARHKLAHRKRDYTRIGRQILGLELLKLRCAKVGMKAFAVDRNSTECLEINVLGNGIVLISLISLQIAKINIPDGRQSKVF